MKITSYLKISFLSLIFVSLFACTNDEPIIASSQDSELDRPKSRSMASDLTTDEALESFAKILSKAVYNHHEIRELLNRHHITL